MRLPRTLLAEAKKYASLHGTTFSQLATKGLRIVLGLDSCPDAKLRKPVSADGLLSEEETLG